MTQARILDPTADMPPVAIRRSGDELAIRFIHEAPTPHNNYLLDAVASVPGVTLHRHYLVAPTAVPGRPWKGMDSGRVQTENIHCGYGHRFDRRLLRLALTDRGSVFFVIGWDRPVLVAALLLLGLRRRPLVMWDDGPSPESLAQFRRFWRPKQILKRLLVALINRTPGTYFHTGQVTRNDILALGIAERKLVSLPFFVREGRRQEHLRRQHRAEGATVLILAGGRLTREKGYDVLLEALGTLARGAHARWHAVLIGSGPEKEPLQALAVRLGLQERLDFVAWAEPETFADYVQTCDLFVAPARFDHFPTTVIAAMQAGVALVASDAVGSAVEFVESGRNGILCPAGSASALAEHLARLVDDAPERLRLAAAGRETMRRWPVERGARMIVDAAREAARACAA